MKTILVHCDGAKSLCHRLAVATDVARRFGALLTALYAKAPFEPPLITGKYPDLDSLFRAHEHSVAADQAAARKVFHQALVGSSLAAEWHAQEGFADKVLVRRSPYADLVVVGQSEPDGVWAIPGDLPQTVAIAGSRPVLVVPWAGARRPVGECVLLCWNGSRESARAAADALPFLAKAKKVIVLIAGPKEADLGRRDEPDTEVAAWLERHGAKVTVERDSAAGADVGEVILSHAAAHDADLVVMGIYGHSRMRETVLGGASRTMLSSMNVPVLMSH
jgi:nucleotide-binding universal stress UspA family protein